MKISKEQLKNFLITHQGLNKKTSSTKENILSHMKKVGCIQYDPLNVVGKNADLVLQSRFQNYSSEKLYELLYKDKMLVDGWDKMMSIYLCSDWGNMEYVRKKHTEVLNRHLTNKKQIEHLQYIEETVNYIKQNGNTMPKHLDLGNTKKWGWGSGKVSSICMDYLFHNGTLGVVDKVGVQKVFNLIEEIIPDKDEILKANSNFTFDDFVKWYVKRRIRSIGIYWDKSGDGWLGHYVKDKVLREKAIKQLVFEKQLINVEVECMKEKFYICKEDVEVLNNLKPLKEKVEFIAPLDNLIWDRKLINSVFDFKYTWEVYVPKEKRKYGYYVLPVLYKNKLIARFEPAKVRKGDIFTIKNWWWEENYTPTAKVIELVKENINSFSNYLGCGDVDENTYKIICENTAYDV